MIKYFNDAVNNYIEGVSSDENNKIIEGLYIKTLKPKIEKAYNSDYLLPLTKKEQFLMENYIIHHSADNDGLCSGFVIKLALPNSEIIGYDHNEATTLIDPITDGAHVTMLDIYLSLENMTNKMPQFPNDITTNVFCKN